RATTTRTNSSTGSISSSTAWRESGKRLSGRPSSAEPSPVRSSCRLSCSGYERRIAEPDARGADVEASIALFDQPAPALGDAPGHRQLIVSGRRLGQVEVFQRPLEREIGGVVAILHLGELGQC